MIKGDKLGSGSYGIVYDIKENDKSYALKRNLSEKETSFISSIRELNILYTLRNHPNIVRLESVVFADQKQQNFSPLLDEDRNLQRDDGVHFIFTKANYDLHDYIYNLKFDQFKQTKKIMVDILLGLEYMHQNKIIHRDIKPGNILIY